jgi:protein-tyrosine phosphatase
VCLNERHELVDRYPAYVEWLITERGARATWFPVPDLHAPLVADMEQLVDGIIARLGDGVVVHCGAGIGRAGTTAVAVLVRTGVALDEALATVDRHRPGAGPEVGEQRRVVETLAAAWQRGRRPM